jgi:hypothetical protein
MEGGEDVSRDLVSPTGGEGGLMSEIETKHKGYNVVLGDDEKTWQCHELNLQAQSLAEIKKRINEIGKSERRINVKALSVERARWSNEPIMIRAVIVTLLEGTHSGDVSDQCWITYNGKTSKVNISDLFPLAQLDSIKRWTYQDAAARAAVDAADDVFEKIPRHSVDSLRKAAKG